MDFNEYALYIGNTVAKGLNRNLLTVFIDDEKVVYRFWDGGKISVPKAILKEAEGNIFLIPYLAIRLIDILK